MPTKRNRKRQQLIVTASVVGGLALVVVVLAVIQLASGPAAPPPAEVAQTPDEPPPAAGEPAAPPEPTGPELIDDDGRTLWASPTSGEPVSLACFPPGCRIVLTLRPAAMLTTADGRIVVEHFRPALERLLAAAGRAAPAIESVERLTIGVRAGPSPGLLETTVVGDSAPPAGGDAEPATPSVRSLGRGRAVAQWSPARLSFGPQAAMDEAVEAGGAAPPLSREMEQLLAASDADRHASLLVAPGFLFGDGKRVFSGDVSALRSPVFEQLPDNLRGLLLSGHAADEGFYWEARGAATAELTATRLASLLDRQMAKWPGELQLALFDLSPAQHGRRVVANLPAMTRLMAQYARWGVEDRQAVLNGYLPPAAGHNLLLAADLVLAQQSAGVTGGVATTVATAPAGPISAVERLAKPATVVFARDTLEMALRYLSDEIGVPIVILGGDLQLDGITKNQSFGLDAPNKPAEAVLLEILSRANPDKTATGPRDPKQKLVYVIQPGDAGAETIYVTTRAAAAKRGDKLPAAFQP
ncbi:MAG: hypothetical protein AAF589_02645 [Planctomycetota bacterium]